MVCKKQCKFDNVPKKRHNKNVRYLWLEVHIGLAAQKEIRKWPLGVKKELGSILTSLQKGRLVEFPDVTPVKTIGVGVNEVRLRGEGGIFRAFYIIETDLGILLFHSFRKKTRKTPKQEIKVAKKRLQDLMQELVHEKK